MAEISQQEHRQKAGVAKPKKSSLRVDLTPMVDLGFLLISFFIFTTTLSHPTVMKLGMPDDRDSTHPLEAGENRTLNIILGNNHQPYVYNGSELNHIKNIGNSITAVRKAVIKKKNEIRNYYGSDSGMTVLIKPTKTSTYADVVNTLDEMVICNVKTYMLIDANASELKAIGQ
ncbi:MAG TPA: biopolymer transporter ExbD [Parafilimonas sp.]|nr:biopolymer transporter ExbD [Parafilimonas sp.]